MSEIYDESFEQHEDLPEPSEDLYDPISFGSGATVVLGLGPCTYDSTVRPLVVFQAPMFT